MSIDLSTLPPPNVVEPLDFETIRSQWIADFQSRYPAFTAILESDPVIKLIETGAYRELLLRQRVNDGARAVMLAYATLADLDQIGANFGVTRKTLDPGDPNAIPPVPPTYESDADFRFRIQLSLEGLSVAGPTGSYISHALSVADVLDASVASPSPGAVVVTVLSRTGNGVAPSGTLTAVNAVLSDQDTRPLTDNVTVQSATITNYSIVATIYTLAGPDPAVVMANAQAAANAYAANQHRLGRDITLSGVYAALHQPGVQRVALTTPSADIPIADDHAPYCTAITLTNGGIGS